MKAFLIQAAAVVLAGAGIGSVAAPWQPIAASAIPQIPITAEQATLQQAGGLTGVGYSVTGSGPALNIHIQGAGPLSGTYFVPAATTGTQVNNDRGEWDVNFTNPAGTIIGACKVFRGHDPLTGLPTWVGFAWVMYAGSPGSGASNGQIVNGQAFTSPVVMTGAVDYNVSGSTQWIGNPAFGAPGTITISVNP